MAEKIRMIALSPTMEEGTIVKWLKKENDSVAAGDVICEVETDKATMDYEAAFDGILLRITAEEGSVLHVGETIAVIGEKGEDFSSLLIEEDSRSSGPNEKTELSAGPDEKPAAPLKQENPALSSKASERIKASPLARKIAADKGIDLLSVSGSGPGGRIIKRDIESSGSGQAIDPPDTALPGADRAVKINSMRRAAARRLSGSMFTAPHYYLKISASVSGLMSERKKINDQREDKISLNAFLIKLAAENLKKHPYLNSSWRENDILLFGSIDIALAVALDDGLITPVVRNCGSKSISEIDSELRVLIARAKSGKLRPEEYSNATFTISNLGSSGIEEFTAVINPPGSAILAVGAIIKTVSLMPDNSIKSHDIIKFTLSCDHRVIDGKTGADFLADFKKSIENPLYALI